MGVPVVFETLEDAQQAAEEFGAYAIWKVRGLLCLPTGDIWSNESGQWLKVPKVSGVLSTQTVSLHKCALPRSANDFAKQSLVSTPCGCLGVSGACP